MKTDPLYKVGIIGLGYVGKTIFNLLGDYVVAVYDPELGKGINRLIKGDNMQIASHTEFVPNDFEKFKGLDLVVICVPTPTAVDGMSCEAKIVEDSCLRLHQIDFKGVILIKSTIAPSIAVELHGKYPRIVFSPEFAGESKYYTPFWKYPDPTDIRTHMWQTFGGDRKDTEVCVEVFKRKMSVDTVYHQTDIVTASLAKYIENAFFAAKVTFVNEWYDICQTYGVDWNELRELWLSDPRINKNHTLVFPKDRGYGGKCFPKDVKAIIADCNKMGYEPKLLRSVNETNNKFRSEI